jgi:hypothetical protein
MTLAFWKENMVRVRYTGRSFAGVDRTVNHGDVVAVSETEAQAWIAAGLAVITTDPVGPAVSSTAGGLCWVCSGGPQDFSSGRCQYCGSRI